ncbi:MAG: glucose-1-phosphate cytidylyltransferase [Zetaproteobacteria bacterium CG06_land_8_20_14_3_00_59_53]|nr:MAG: glucose-1-phosphate cytidylyltransferase [Zetaproteobacteria bacterium CG2_30_59_37]PIO89881.1 MAG: glucose-1-phosphate cytidylyltransferase [Zetaproteobacteria bacterium CG23_combo_of_CG06-09_8_20_14_all_59_86]PIQ64246.1 MAG: glucose-1-phosphate cytidylyltransferase [Zetaproteobacteria bacterium CG11_big_fil_rev_8_21_14_0_20_59_439]PIU70408.1 MAG: glucose-1-phosphate cytidylyltransferase [Zetaproteobacteria bacterium CG06_land_8_20_14_3_00_59_53]PIU97468.1 MAG: glucose-1-phosphate cyti
MKVVILCGGFGTRIRDVSDNVPKPMIPIGRYPIVWHIMKYYASFGFKEFILCLGYKSHVIKDFFLNYEAHTKDFTIQLGRKDDVQFHTDHDESDWRVTLADTGLDALTGARIRKIRNYIGDDEHFMLTYGDGVGDIDIESLLAFHKKSGKILTVTGVRPPGRFGELIADSDDIVTEFNEKPQATKGRISGGFFVCHRDIFNYFDERDNLMFEQEPMNRLVADRQMCLYKHDGFWQPMDTSREYQLLNSLYEKGNAPWVR